MNRREKTLLVLVLLLTLSGGAWYYAHLQNAFVPENVQTPNGTEQSAIDVPRLESESVVTGLSNVWDLGFLPDGTMLFTERSGTISKVHEGQRVVLHAIDNVFVRGEGGLLGLAVDLEFEQNRFIYVCYNTPEDVRVSRWVVNEDVTGLAGQTDIITGMPVNPSGRHSGCRPQVDGQGNLWVGTGDVAVGSHPQDPASLGGKILRVNRDGQPVEGNLGEPFDPRIFSYGHRNVQGLVLFESPRAGAFGYSAEHGPDRDDEVNVLTSGNFGWDPVPGYNERVPMTDTDKFPDAVAAIWSSGSPPIAASGATLITGDSWKAYENRLAVAALRGQHLRLFEFDAGGRRVLDERQLFVGEFGRLRSTVMSPDNSLYLTTDNGSSRDEIIKITPH